MTHPAFRFTALAAAAIMLAACSSVPERNLALDQAHQRMNAAQADPAVARHASDELQRAAVALQRADKARLDDQPLATIDHLAYLAGQRVLIAQQTASARSAQAVTAGAAAERDRMRLALRTQEADMAQRQVADVTQQAALAAQAARDASQRATDQARQQAAMADHRRDMDAAQADSDAAAARERLARSDSRAEALEQQLKAMDARRTERGIVVTLGDVLFDSGRSSLQSTSSAGITRLAEFMRNHPDRSAAIEGNTDDVGAEALNQALSDQRAESVRAALMGMGVAAGRLSTQGHGERRPVASNATAAGRQANRRVEIIFASEPTAPAAAMPAPVVRQ